jgi:hypothetical protein
VGQTFLSALHPLTLSQRVVSLYGTQITGRPTTVAGGA